MPIYNGNYAAPVWVNGVPPTIGATELEAMTGTAERSQVLHGSGAPGSGTAGEIGQLYADMSVSPVEFYRMTGVSAGGGFIWESEHDIEDNLTTTYDSSGTYAAGDFCLYGGLLYEAAVDILTPEEWTAAHWQGVTAADAETAHFARRDNPHEVTAAQAGLGNLENVLQYSAANPAIKRGTVALVGTWSGAASPYTKTIAVTGPTVTGKSYVELQFTPAQMDSLMNRGVRAIHVYNNGGVLTAMAWGGVPGNMTAQCTVEELMEKLTRVGDVPSHNGDFFIDENGRMYDFYNGVLRIQNGFTGEIIENTTAAYGWKVFQGGEIAAYKTQADANTWIFLYRDGETSDEIDIGDSARDFTAGYRNGVLAVVGIQGSYYSQSLDISTYTKDGVFVKQLTSVSGNSVTADVVAPISYDAVGIGRDYLTGFFEIHYSRYAVTTDVSVTTYNPWEGYSVYYSAYVNSSELTNISASDQQYIYGFAQLTDSADQSIKLNKWLLFRWSIDNYNGSEVIAEYDILTSNRWPPTPYGSFVQQSGQGASAERMLVDVSTAQTLYKDYLPAIPASGRVRENAAAIWIEGYGVFIKIPPSQVRGADF